MKPPIPNQGSKGQTYVATIFGRNSVMWALCVQGGLTNVSIPILPPPLSAPSVPTTFSGQLFLMDRFLDGTFFTFGIEVISFALRDEEDRVDPVIYIFPRMTKCTFHKFGTSGNIESHDALCILPINIINEKIYVFLWFYFLLLAVLTGMVVFYRLIIIVSPRMRAYLLYIRFRLIKKECINIIIKKAQMGDWFLLYMLGQNVDSMIFKEVIHELARRLGYQSKDLIDF